jgi:hypothetical protein
MLERVRISRAGSIDIARGALSAVQNRRGQCRLPIRRASSKLCATLDFSRGLRVDEPNLPKAIPGAPEAAVPKPGTPPGTGTIVFYGDPAQVAEGFAIALRAMGIDQSDAGEDPNA